MNCFDSMISSAGDQRTVYPNNHYIMSMCMWFLTLIRVPDCQEYEVLGVVEWVDARGGDADCTPIHILTVNIVIHTEDSHLLGHVPVGGVKQEASVQHVGVLVHVHDIQVNVRLDLSV